MAFTFRCLMSRNTTAHMEMQRLLVSGKSLKKSRISILNGGEGTDKEVSISISALPILFIFCMCWKYIWWLILLCHHKGSTSASEQVYTFCPLAEILSKVVILMLYTIIYVKGFSIHLGICFSKWRFSHVFENFLKSKWYQLSPSLQCVSELQIKKKKKGWGGRERYDNNFSLSSFPLTK